MRLSRAAAHEQPAGSAQHAGSRRDTVEAGGMRRAIERRGEDIGYRRRLRPVAKIGSEGSENNRVQFGQFARRSGANRLLVKSRYRRVGRGRCSTATVRCGSKISLPVRRQHLGVQILRLVPGSEGGSRPFRDTRPACEVETPARADFPEYPGYATYVATCANRTKHETLIRRARPINAAALLRVHAV